MCRLEPFLKRSLVVLLFLGLTEACIPREVAMEEKSKNFKGIVGLMSRLSPDGFRQNIISSSKTPPLVTTPDRTEEESKYFQKILGLLSLQVLNEETNDCQEEVKSPPATTTAKALVRHGGWSFLRCAYMVMTFFFVSYNKGDWCYCHYCNPDVDVRYGTARSGEVSSLANGPREVDFKLFKLHFAIERDGNQCSGAPWPHSRNRGDKGRGLETNPGGRGREGRRQGNRAEVVVPKGDKGPPQDREETGVARRKVAVYKDKR
nr:epididymal protein 13 isoform X2 [Peromyscus maniculatus bairdii]